MNATACPLESQTVEDEKLGRISAYFFRPKIGDMLDKAGITTDGISKFFSTCANSI